MALRKIPIRRVGHRANLFLDGDRELVMFSGLLAFALIFAAMTWLATAYGFTLWFFSLYVFRALAKSDPLLRQVYLRHRLYRAYYPAHSTPFRQNTSRQGRQYR